MKSTIRSIAFAVAALPVLACGGSPQGDTGGRGETTEKAVAALASQTDAGTPNAGALAAELAKDPTFRALSDATTRRIDGILAIVSGLRKKDLGALSTQLQSCHDAANWQTCNQGLAALGIETSLSAEEAELGGRLVEQFGLQGTQIGTLALLFREADTLRGASARGSRERSTSIPDTFGAGAFSCNVDCADWMNQQLALPHAMFMAQASISSGGGAGGVILGELVKVAAELAKELIECWINPDCNAPGEQPDDEIECRNDDDCASNEYCADGFLDLGSNECRPKKSNGTNCSADSQCQSGCCNFNLFGSECATPNKCN